MNLKRPADRGFVIGTMLLATSVLLVTAAILLGIASGSTQSLQAFGLGFIVDRVWDPVQQVFGALPFIYGTLVTALIALLLAGLVGIGSAIFLAEYSPPWLRTPLSFFVELLAAIPSIVYGVWGLFVLAPFLRANVVPFL